jgi:hypothetical protein
LTNTRCSLYSFQLLMMGGRTVWNMQSIYSNKYDCVTLHVVRYAWIVVVWYIRTTGTLILSVLLRGAQVSINHKGKGPRAQPCCTSFDF